METLFEKEENGLGVITVKFTRQDYQVDFDEEAKKVAKNINMKGFRQGKVPPELIKKMYGAQLRTELVTKKVNQVVDEYIEANQIGVFGSPFMKTDQELLNIEEVEKGKTAEVRFHVILLPEIPFEIDKSISITYPAILVDEKDIDNRIQALRQQESRTESITEITADASISAYAVALEGEEVFKHLGFLDIQKFKPEYQEKLLGLKSGDILQLSLLQSYSDESDLYRVFGLEKEEDKQFLASNEVNLRISRVYKTVLPEINQDFFDIFSTEERPIQNEADFRAWVRNQVTDDYERITNQNIIRAVETYFYDRVPFELSPETLKQYFKSNRADNGFLAGLESPDGIQRAMQYIREFAILDLLAHKLGIEVTQQELYQEATAKIYRMYNTYRIPIKSEDIPAIVSHYLNTEDGKNRTQILHDIRKTKTMMALSERVTMLPQYVYFDEFIKSL